FHALAGFINLKCLQLRWSQGVGDKIPYVGVPTDDVHLLIVELPHDILHALSAQANTSADRVYLLVTRPDCQLGAETRLTGDTLDFDGAVVDFRNFELEQLDHKPRVGPRKNDFR